MGWKKLLTAIKTPYGFINSIWAEMFAIKSQIKLIIEQNTIATDDVHYNVNNESFLLDQHVH